MNDVLIRPDFLSREQCNDLIHTMQRQHDRYLNKIANNRVEIPAWEAEYPPALATLRVYRDEMTQLIRGVFQEFVHLEYCILKASFTGDYCEAHSDNCKDDGSPNHTAIRTHTCNLYLNDAGKDYQGGGLDFPERSMKIMPQAGMLVAFPSGRAFKHEVPPIISGVRYALLSWFTGEETHRMRGF